jgi:hypothetical protein
MILLINYTTQEMFGNKLPTIIILEKTYAGIGFHYDQARDAFIAPKPFNSWILNEGTCRWEAPVAKPTDDNKYSWNETNLTWDIVE